MHVHISPIIFTFVRSCDHLNGRHDCAAGQAFMHAMQDMGVNAARAVLSMHTKNKNVSIDETMV